MLGKGMPIVTTALALSSVKSSPSLTFPRQTAIKSAPSEDETKLLSHGHQIKKASAKGILQKITKDHI